jgi:hypothetical protein
VAIIARSTPTMVCCMNHDAHSSVPLLSLLDLTLVKRNDTCKGAWNLVRSPGRQGISATRIRVCIKVTIQHVQHIARQEHMWCVCKDFEMVKIHSKSSHWSVQKIQNLVHPFTVHIFIYSVAKFLVKTHSSLFHTLFQKKLQLFDFSYMYSVQTTDIAFLLEYIFLCPDPGFCIIHRFHE